MGCFFAVLMRYPIQPFGLGQRQSCNVPHSSQHNTSSQSLHHHAAYLHTPFHACIQLRAPLGLSLEVYVMILAMPPDGIVTAVAIRVQMHE